METKQKQLLTDQRDPETWVDHVLDAMPFMFAAFVIVLVLLAMMSPQVESIYSNTINLI